MPAITIEFTGPREEVDAFLESLLETDSVEMGTEKHLPDGGGTLTMGGELLRKSAGAPHAVEVIFSLGRDLAVGVAGAYLYDKLKGSKSEKLKMTVEYQEVQLDKGEITKIIEAELKLNEDD
jgi:hypothetical protein